MNNNKVKFSYKWAMPHKWSFKIKCINDFILKEIKKSNNILIPFAGETRYRGYTNITYIDIEERPQPCIKGDCVNVMEELIKKGEKYDLAILDPPYSYFQGWKLYGNERLSASSKVKNLVNQLMVSNGIVITLGYNSTGMGNTRNFKKVEILLVNHGGCRNDTIVLKEKKLNQLKI